MDDNLKTFNDLSFHPNGHRFEAEISFSTGWGVHISLDPVSRNYSGILLQNGKTFSEPYATDIYPSMFPKQMRVDQVDWYMKKVQELEPVK